MAAKLDIVFLLYPGVSYLDFMGPQAVFGLLPGARQIFASVGGQPIREGALTLHSLTRLEDVERCDVLCVPGGPIGPAVEDAVFMEGVRRLAATARFVTSVCTGSLILGAAGLLEGRRAACHWAVREQLAHLGAIPDAGRVVRDGHIVTGGGVTAGIDFGLTLAAELAGPEVAQAIQLMLEYAPAPPFNAGRPETAPEAALARMPTLTMGELSFDPAAEEAIVRRAGAALRASRA
ncbi:DJ-1/PfpI family protein [Archangium gephyra]|uniref:DJ-1/PfpI family protein n=1 Tax=Archangium gephyra TaxID=48 RepID=A0AAC8TDZ5_9BACT|nr:DJ-1/PfpI family protein [Archangium gephyra]AKJ02367.1 Transcriptional regulator, AraC family [Archangium gephyra]REG28706.1 DJ-1/PfpI family protein [Archangium gephyra]